MNQNFNKDKQDEINEVIENFHSVISKILKMVDSKIPGDIEVDRLKRLVRMARDEAPLIIITKCKQKIWDSREQILARDENYFLKKKFGEYIKKDKNQMFIEGLIDLVKRGYNMVSDKEKDYIWNLNKQLLEYVIRYKMLTGDHE